MLKHTRNTNNSGICFFVSRFTMNDIAPKLQKCWTHKIAFKIISKTLKQPNFFYSQPSTFPKEALANFYLPTTTTFYETFCSLHHLTCIKITRLETVSCEFWHSNVIFDLPKPVLGQKCHFQKPQVSSGTEMSFSNAPSKFWDRNVIFAWHSVRRYFRSRAGSPT